MIKRAFDLFFAFVALVLLAPVLLVLVILIRQKMGSPVFFRQTRAGFHGHPFEVIKFRTMKNSVDTTGRLLSDAERLTKFGCMLRTTSLDELPELWCILRGDMSFVGPRPLLMEYLPLYSQRQQRRHELRPGLSGLAQVNGRNSLSWHEKFELDVWYVENQGFWLDIKIIILTLVKVFRRDGISAEGDATMPKFEGN
jgi:lipopolysaccharide/colanic/teichoic acid biosynthesis glycosyltransferase